MPPRAVIVRPVRATEHAALGALTVAAYRELPGAVLSDGYEAELRDVAGRAVAADVLVAVDGDGGEVLGGVTYVPVPGGPMAEFDDPDAAGIRMLAVAPASQGRGVGRALAQVCVERARAAGRRRVVLHSTPWMTAAHRLYRRLGFVRAPDLDESYPEVDLLAFVLELPPEE